jgi:hypothetical protein
MRVSRFTMCSWNSRLFRFVRKIAKSDYKFRHVCLSAWNSSAPTGQIFMKFDVRAFFEKLSRKFQFHRNLKRKTGALDHWTFLIMSSSVLFRMRNISNKSCRGNQNTFFVEQLFFFLKSCILWDNVEKYCREGQATDDNMAHALCMLDN